MAIETTSFDFANKCNISDNIQVNTIINKNDNLKKELNAKNNNLEVLSFNNQYKNQLSAIVIREEDCDSSSIDSDSDDAKKSNNLDLKKKLNAQNSREIILINEPQSIGNMESNSSNIGSIAVQNSSDITFGNKTFYQGPVTIKQQFLLDHNWKETGNHNEAYTQSNSNISTTNKDSGGYIICTQIL